MRDNTPTSSSSFRDYLIQKKRVLYELLCFGEDCQGIFFKNRDLLDFQSFSLESCMQLQHVLWSRNSEGHCRCEGMGGWAGEVAGEPTELNTGQGQRILQWGFSSVAHGHFLSLASWRIKMAPNILLLVTYLEVQERSLSNNQALLLA